LARTTPERECAAHSRSTNISNAKEGPDICISAAMPDDTGSLFEAKQELLMAEHDYRNAQRDFELATASGNQTQISSAARAVATTLGELARVRQRYEFITGAKRR
jgi:hypothetical protein